MASSRRMALGLAWVVLVAGCGGSRGGGRSRLEARARRALAAGRARGGGRPPRDRGRAGRARFADPLRRRQAPGGDERLPHPSAPLRGPGAGAAAGRAVLAQAGPPGARSRPPRALPGRLRHRRSGLDVSGSSSSRTAARRCSPAAPRACPTRSPDSRRRYSGPGGRTRPGRAPDHLRHLEHRRICARRRASSRAGSRRARSTSTDHDFNGLPVLTADDRARATRPTIVLHGHLDVVPGRAGAVRAARRGRPADTAAAPTT